MFSGMIIFSIVSDTLLKRKAASGGGVMKPEYRLPPMVASAFFVPAGLFIYGWTAEYLVHWFWPIFGTAWLGFGLLGVFVRFPPSLHSYSLLTPFFPIPMMQCAKS